MHLALGTSLATIVGTSLSSSWSHHKRGSVRWDVALKLAPGIVIGTWLGAAIADHANSEDLKIGFGIAEMLLGVYIWRKKAATERVQESNWSIPTVTGAGLGIGSLAALAGIGGGTLSVPYLLRSGLAMTRAVGTSAACGVPIAISGSLSYLYWGWDAPGLPPHAWGYVYWPAALGIMLTSASCAPFGAMLAHRWSEASLKKAFALLLVLLGAKMLFF